MFGEEHSQFYVLCRKKFLPTMHKSTLYLTVTFFRFIHSFEPTLKIYIRGKNMKGGKKLMVGIK